MLNQADKDHLRRCVATGVEFLETEDRNWRDHIDVNELDMEDTDRCVVGQLCRDRPRSTWPEPFKRFCEDMGFDLGTEHLSADALEVEAWEFLRVLWADEVASA